MDISEEFIAHGGYTVSNAGGYEVQISSCGGMARMRDCFGSDNPKVSEWFEIEHLPNEDGETEEIDGETFPVLEAIIDPDGYNIPLSMVMRL